MGSRVLREEPLETIPGTRSVFYPKFNTKNEIRFQMGYKVYHCFTGRHTTPVVISETSLATRMGRGGTLYPFVRVVSIQVDKYPSCEVS